jgi:hypothetical protein
MESLSIGKEVAKNFNVKRFYLKNINEMDSKEKYEAKISKRFPALGDLDNDVDKNRDWEIARENIKILVKENLGY